MRIKILEGRQLAGANISPVVKVILGKEAKQTRVKSSTNRPHYDEVRSQFFYFIAIKDCICISFCTFDTCILSF